MLTCASVPAAPGHADAAEPAAISPTPSPPGASADDPPSPRAPSPGSRTARNSVFAEFLGNGIVYSLNYERFLGEDRGVAPSLRIGVSVIPWLAVPFLANVYVGGLDHKLQIGVGATIVTPLPPDNAHGNGPIICSCVIGLPTAVVGYRYVPHDGGFNFGLGFTPLFNVQALGPGSSFGDFLPLVGASMGAGF
jgi:hypothetical protein